MNQESSKPIELIPAVGYLRKSTKGKRADGRERQEKSIGQQRTEITKLAKRLGYEIIDWYSDEGISGWKTGNDRPSYDKLLSNAERHGNFSAIFVDNLDRLSRATPFKVAADLNRLAEAGVADIFCANGDRYHIKDEHNYGEVFRIVAVLMGNAEYSRQLGRRVAIAHRNNAQQGRRSGGVAPFGMQCDGKGGLQPGSKDEVRVIRWIFEWFVNKLCSANEIANRLNRKKIPASAGGKWCRQTILDILDRECYAGTFTWNARSKGQFWFTENGEVKDASDRTKTKGNGMIRKERLYKGIISKSLWQRAQKRRMLNAQRHRKPRSTTASLARVLICDHCGKYLESFTKRGHTYYRCSTAGRYGKDACGYYSVAENKLLPRVMTTFSEEIDKLLDLGKQAGEGSQGPKRRPLTKQRSRKTKLDQEIAVLDRRIESGAMRLLECDERVRDALNKQLTELVIRKEALVARLDANEVGMDDDQTLFLEDINELGKWWKTFRDGALILDETESKESKHGEPPAPDASFIPILDGEQSNGSWYLSSSINEALHTLGVAVYLSWRREEPKAKRARNVLLPMRFRMGQEALQEMSGPRADQHRKILLGPSCAGAHATKPGGIQMESSGELGENRKTIEP